MAIVQISQEQVDEFLEEQPTDRIILLEVERQVNSARSLAGFSAAARDVTSPPHKRHWTEELSASIDELEPVTDDMIIDEGGTGKGWAGRVAR